MSHPDPWVPVSTFRTLQETDDAIGFLNEANVPCGIETGPSHTPGGRVATGVVVPVRRLRGMGA